MKNNEVSYLIDNEKLLLEWNISKKTRKRQYLDQFGKDAHNVTDASGKTRGRSKSEFQRATHYIIKKRK